ncbi:MAG: N-6 DNA methylase [Candidatus Sericytochromatia bacterium]|nr:N-6 DNA methylase [Candidatus Sericytochromatia bacterium]
MAGLLAPRGPEGDLGLLADLAMGLRDLLPEDVAADGRHEEAAIFLVACALDGVLRDGAGGRLRGLVRGIQEASMLTAPLLTDEVSRRRQAIAAERMDSRVARVLAPGAWSPERADVLGHLLEAGLGQTRKLLGQFYTPDTIVHWLLDHGLADFDPRQRAPFRILDPSCGAGHFLVAAADRLMALYRRHRDALVQANPGEPWDDEALVGVIFRDHLMGVDIDPWALRVARIRLGLKAMALGARHAPLPRLGHGDALRRDEGRRHRMLVDAVHLVVGNPPYGAALEEDQKAYVSSAYQLGRGRYDSTALFIERAIDLLAPGGRVALVVPHGVTRTGAYGPCRDLLRERTDLLALLDAGAVFPGVNLETMAFVARTRTALDGDGPPPVVLASMRGGPLHQLGVQDAAFFAARKGMPIYVAGARGPLITRLERDARPLGLVARIQRGAAISARDPRLRPDSEGLPVVRGRDLSRYGAVEPSALLAWTERHPLSGRTWDGLSRPTIAFQNVASEVVATMLPEGVLPLDTVNILTWEGEAPDAEDGWALLGWLNSRLAAWLFRTVLSNHAALTVHMDAPTLGPLPVLLREPAPVARQARALWQARTSGHPPEQLENLARDLDRLLMRQAGLSPEEMALVLNETRPIAWSGRRRRGT